MYLYVRCGSNCDGNAPPPLWLSDLNFITWKDYMLIPLVFVGGGPGHWRPKSYPTVVILTASLSWFIDRSSLFESMTEDLDKTSMRIADSCSFGLRSTKRRRSCSIWHVLLGVYAFPQRKKLKLFGYGIVRSQYLLRCTRFFPRRICRNPLRRALFSLLKDRKLHSAPWDLSIDMGSRSCYRRPSARLL